MDFQTFDFNKMSWPWNLGQWSLTVIGTDTDRSAKLLKFHSNHGPVSYHFWDKRQFQSKIEKLAMHMHATTWPVQSGCKIITYLKSQITSFLLTVQLTSGYDDS